MLHLKFRASGDTHDPWKSSVGFILQ